MMRKTVNKYAIWLFLPLTIFVGCINEPLPNAKINARILVQPYLQLATPTSIYIKWETDIAVTGSVDWGLSEKLGQSKPASLQTGFGSSAIHQVQLTNLTPNTIYHYQVKAGNSSSKVHQFKTPPLADSEQATRILAISDM